MMVQMIAKLPWREKVLFQICREAHVDRRAASGEFSHRGYIATVGKEALVWRCQDGKSAEGRFCHLTAPARLLSS